MNATHVIPMAAYDMTTDRSLVLIALSFAILGVVLGVRALRAARLSPATGASSLVGLVIAAWVLLTADGGAGTGNGVVGAVVVLALGAAGMLLGALAHRAEVLSRKTHPRP